MANIVKFYALGGLDESGKNLYCLEINDDIFVLEAGMKFPEKSNTGIDMIIPDISYLVENKDRVKAYFISHGHDDIMAALPYIIQDVPAPVYCSATASSNIEITAQRMQLKPDFNFKLVASGDEVNIAGHKTYFFATTHSARDSLGIAIETGDGLAIYTGDFIFDYEALTQYRTDVNLLARLGDKKPLLLMCESNACDKRGHTSPKHKITPIIEPIFADHKGRIFISIYYQNVFGIREAMDMAVKYQRKMYISGDILKEILDYTLDDDLKRIMKKICIRENELKMPGNENVIIMVGGQGEEVFTDLSRMAHGEDRLFTIRPDDAVIIASPLVPGLEVYGTKVVDDLFQTGAHIININKKEVASMHARAEDIKMMISILKPKYYIPVKGDYHHLVLNTQIAKEMNLGYDSSNTFVFDNGMVARFENGEYAGIENIIGLTDRMIDGFDIGAVESKVLEDRNRLGEEGVLILGISVDTVNKQIVCGPDVQMRGLIFLKDADDLVTQIVTTFNDMVDNALKEGLINDDDTRVKIHDKLVSLVRRHTNKDPLVLPIIMDISKK